MAAAADADVLYARLVRDARRAIRSQLEVVNDRLPHTGRTLDYFVADVLAAIRPSAIDPCEDCRQPFRQYGLHRKGARVKQYLRCSCGRKRHRDLPAAAVPRRRLLREQND